MSNRSRIFESLLIFTFLTGLILPLLLTHNREMSTNEKRKLKPLPEVKWDIATLKSFPSQFEDFFNDHFGLRDGLARLYSFISLKLKSSPNPDVLIGKEDWMFYIKAADGNSYEDHLGNDPLTPSELKQWKTVLEAKELWLDSKGIKFLFVIAPDKQSIYGEYLPSRVNQATKPTRLDQFVDYMRDSEVEIIDLRQTLIQAKPKGLLYYKTDSHWNDFGAAIAGNEILRHLSVNKDTLPVYQYDLKDFKWVSRAGDIAKMIDMASYLKEPAPRLREPLPECVKFFLEEPLEPSGKPPFYTDCNSKSIKVLFFRDSFATALQPYISPYVAKCYFIWKQPGFNQLETYFNWISPDVVIEQRAERSLKNVPSLK